MQRWYLTMNTEQLLLHLIGRLQLPQTACGGS
jgi:hypothetical protein